MKTVIIVSKCLRVTPLSKEERWFEFHFKGVCSGEYLKRLMLKGRLDFQIKKNEEYILYVEMVSFENGTLTGNILRAKLLSECWDRS